MRQAAHDLATLLTVSIGHTQKAMEHLAKAQIANDRMAAIVKRMQTGRLSGPAGNFDLNTVALELEGSIEALGGVSVQLRHAADPIFVAGDALSMHRALFNLCLNARNAGATLIVIETMGPGDRNAGEATVMIQDNGSGFDEDALGNVWNLPMTKGGLHGHGLAIVKRTVAQHHGKVEVMSGPAGTKFTIHLPIAVPRLGTAGA